MKCPECGSSLVSLYCRNGAGGKRWVKIKNKYCKVCNRVMKDMKIDKCDDISCYWWKKLPQNNNCTYKKRPKDFDYENCDDYESREHVVEG